MKVIKDWNILNKQKEDNIETLFEDVSSIYKNKYLIKTNKKEYNTYLIGKTDKYLITFNEEKIYIDDIISINKIN